MDTLQQRFEEKFKDFNFHHKGLPCFNDAVLRHAILTFIISEIKQAENRGENMMKEKCLKAFEETGMIEMYTDLAVREIISSL